MPHIDLITTNLLSPELYNAIEQAPMPGLGAEPKCKLTLLAVQHLAAAKDIRGTLLEAALWLLAGELDRSHTLSQSFENSDGSYWHGIMHRREGDFWNSKYWFRRVGPHPVLSELAKLIASQASDIPFGDSAAFKGLQSHATLAESLVDCCELAQSAKPELTEQLELICWWEWQLLYKHLLS